MEKLKKGKQVSKAGLKDRGWTKSLVKKYLPEHPDQIVYNPYGLSCNILYYKLYKITDIENTEAFIADKIIADKRSIAAKKPQKHAQNNPTISISKKEVK